MCSALSRPYSCEFCSGTVDENQNCSFQACFACFGHCFSSRPLKKDFSRERELPKLFPLLFLTVGASLTKFQRICRDQYILNQLELANLLPLVPFQPSCSRLNTTTHCCFCTAAHWRLPRHHHRSQEYRFSSGRSTSTKGHVLFAIDLWKG